MCASGAELEAAGSNPTLIALFRVASLLYVHFLKMSNYCFQIFEVIHFNWLKNKTELMF